MYIHEDETAHEIIPSAREKHGYNTTAPENIILLSSKMSHRVDDLYKQKTPLEQLALFYLINQSVLRHDVRSEIRDLSILPPDEFFEDTVLSDPTDHDVRRFVEYIQNGKRIFVDGNGAQPRKRERDEHHIIPRSRRNDGFETRRGINSFRDIGRQFHARWHTLYGNKHPLEILEKDFERNKKVYKESVRNRIGELVMLHKDDFYKEEVLAPETEKKLAIF